MTMAKPDIVEVVGKKRVRSSESLTQKAPKKNRQDDVLKAMGESPVTERHILEAVGDNRYTREILRRLMTLNVVTRVGKGGSNDPFLYRVVKGASLDDMLLVDPALEIRLVRIENKIITLLRAEATNVTEKQIRATVGDNTGTGKALRRLVKSGRVVREGRGGAGNPFTYRMGEGCEDAILVEEDKKVAAVAAVANPVVRTPPRPTKKATAAAAATAAASSSIPTPVKTTTMNLRARPRVIVRFDDDDDDFEDDDDVESLDSVPSGPAAASSRSSGSGRRHAVARATGDDAGAFASDATSGDVSDGELSDGDLSDGETEEDDRDSLMMEGGMPTQPPEEDADCDLGSSDESEDNDTCYGFADSDDATAHDDGDGMDISCVELSVVGRACGIMVSTAEEAYALNQQISTTPGASDALVDSFLA